jgi:hypothetical protein
MMIRTLIMVIVAGIGLSGCAAIGLTALGASALSGGAGAAVRAGTEYTKGGTVYRTFTLPQDQLREVVSDTFARMELAIVQDEMDGVDRKIVAHARGRVITLTLQPLTRQVTRAHLAVATGRLGGKDRATASEIVVQLEHTADDVAAASIHTAPNRRDCD